MFAVSLFANIDHGTLPAGSVVIADDLGMNNAQYGLLGSVVFAGIALGKYTHLSLIFIYCLTGSIFGVKIFNMMHPKYILIGALIIAGVFSWAFTQTKVFELLVLIRFMSGFSQSFVSIFLPVWADRYAPSEGAKQCWLSGILMSSTVGVLFGYVITAAFITHLNWHWSFYF